MFNFVKIAIKNLARNRRRNIITIIAILFGVALIILAWGLINGSLDAMVQSAISTDSGHLKILDKNTYIDAASPRLKTQSVISNADETKSSIVTVLGVNPQREKKATIVAKQTKEGSYLKENDYSVVLGYDLDRSFIYIPLKISQKINNFDNKVSEILITLKDRNKINEAKAEIQKEFKNNKYYVYEYCRKNPGNRYS